MSFDFDADDFAPTDFDAQKPRKGRIVISRAVTFRAKVGAGIRLRETIKLCIELFRVFGEKVRV